MEYIRVTKENPEQEHICCAISSNKDIQVSSKKQWLSGSFKGHGYSNDLLGECIRDSREEGRKGLCILSSAKKRPFLADPKFLSHKGFTVCDTADNGVQLWHLPFDSEGKFPEFKECANGEYVSNEILSDKKFLKMIEA